MTMSIIAGETSVDFVDIGVSSEIVGLPRVCTIGTCRVKNTVEWARPRIGDKVILDNRRLYTFTHTTKEALQHIDFMFGQRAIPPEIWPLISTKPYIDEPREELPVPDFFIVEISSLKDLIYRGFHIKLNLFRQAIDDLELLKIFWRFPSASDLEQRQGKLLNHPRFANQKPAIRDALLETTGTTQALDELVQDLELLKSRLSRILIVTHCEAAGGDGEPIAGRIECIEMVRTAAERVGLPVFEPGALMSQWRQSQAMPNHGLDTVHYRRPFGRLIGASLCNIAARLAEGEDDAVAAYLASASLTEQQVSHLRDEASTADQPADLCSSKRDLLAAKLLKRATKIAASNPVSFVQALKTLEDFAPDSEFVAEAVNRHARKIASPVPLDAQADWMSLRTLSADSLLRLAAVFPASPCVFEGLARVIRIGALSQVNKAWTLLIQHDQLFEAASALSPRLKEPEMEPRAPNFEKDAVNGARERLARGEVSAAGVGVLAAWLVRTSPDAERLVKLDAHFIRGLIEMRMGSEPNLTPSDETLIAAISNNPPEMRAARAALVVSLARAARPQEAAQQVTSAVWLYPDMARPFQKLFEHAASAGATWLAGPLAIGLLEIPAVRPWAAKKIHLQFRDTHESFKVAIRDGVDPADLARKLLILDPDHSRGREAMAEALANRGDWQGALEYWQDDDDDDDGGDDAID